MTTDAFFVDDRFYLRIIINWAGSEGQEINDQSGDQHQCNKQPFLGKKFIHAIGPLNPFQFTDNLGVCPICVS